MAATPEHRAFGVATPITLCMQIYGALMKR